MCRGEHASSMKKYAWGLWLKVVWQKISNKKNPCNHRWMVEETQDKEMWHTAACDRLSPFIIWFHNKRYWDRRWWVLMFRCNSMIFFYTLSQYLILESKISVNPLDGCFFGTLERKSSCDAFVVCCRKEKKLSEDTWWWLHTKILLVNRWSHGRIRKNSYLWKQKQCE